MKILSTVTLLLFLTACSGGSQIATIKLGKKCSKPDANNLSESSLIWFVSKDALPSFNQKINKSNCPDS
tara:strand:- start:653 stop:859 length:207 start_codon:yes stop_codon:yes gene_type:complete